MRTIQFAFMIMLFFALNLSPAQESNPDKKDLIENLKRELSEMRKDLDSLKALQGNGSFVTDSDLENTVDRLEKRLDELDNKIDAVSRASAPTALNPRTTAFINFAARADNKSVVDASGESEIDNRAYLRSAELELRNAVDPYAEAVAILTLEDQAGKGFAADAEEAYGLIKRLPLLETAPLGVKVKIGRFRAPIGVNNKIHMHDLPWTTRPLVISEYLGTEHGNFFESGFNPTGIDLDFFLPSPISETTLEMNADIVRAGDLGLSGGHSGRQPAYIGHINFSKDWSNEHLLILGVSTYQENGTESTRLYGADLTYRWAPAEDRESHSFVAGGELFSGDRRYSDSLSAQLRSRPFGWYGYVQYQASFWTYLGLRYDWLEDPFDNSQISRAAALYASYYTTEFLRLRIGFEHRWSDIAAWNNTNTGILEVNFVFGSHPTEPYWVNR